MKNTIIIGAVVLVLVVAFGWFWQSDDTELKPAGESQETAQQTPEQTALQFMQYVIDAAPGTGDSMVAEQVYASLSATAQANISEDIVMQEMSRFVGIQEVPDQGVNVLDVSADDGRAQVRLELQYSGGVAERDMILVMEQGVWKVESVVHTSDTEPDISQPLPAPNESDNDVIADRNGCYVGGCSGQVCSDDPDVMTTCEWREEYACYQKATCERQTDGACGWTETDELRSCLVETQPIQ